ncbi:unnamed protein product [Cuscuta campestris]|uniref:Thiolase C-terminal domain-containing protein n=1 Tax=Cuscuta campestris TaxID=132261 RepID=A0A484LMW0_9ASTE|nr:unnamed protein product [Cuscuta campestris]
MTYMLQFLVKEEFTCSLPLPVVALANLRLLNLDLDKLNVHGGGVSLGHLLACSGARILVTLLGVVIAISGRSVPKQRTYITHS